MKEGDKVILKSFNGTTNPEENVDSSENYWQLIGNEGIVTKNPEDGTIYASFSKEKRVLVKFNVDLDLMKLENHNKVKNALWILESDLKI